jgi:hypothetical protein
VCVFVCAGTKHHKVYVCVYVCVRVCVVCVSGWVCVWAVTKQTQSVELDFGPGSGQRSFIGGVAPNPFKYFRPKVFQF